MSDYYTVQYLASWGEWRTTFWSVFKWRARRRLFKLASHPQAGRIWRLTWKEKPLFALYLTANSNEIVQCINAAEMAACKVSNRHRSGGAKRVPLLAPPEYLGDIWPL